MSAFNKYKKNKEKEEQPSQNHDGQKGGQVSSSTRSKRAGSNANASVDIPPHNIIMDKSVGSPEIEIVGPAADPIFEKIELNQDLEKLAKTSDFKRLIYRAIVGKTHRGDEKSLDKKLLHKLKKVRGN